jgi:hypothetical protein
VERASLSRRDLLTAAAASATSGTLARAAPGRRPRIAAITTEFRKWSHADVLIPKFVTGCDYPGAEFKPEVTIASLYLDQTPANDIGLAFAREHGIPVYSTIAGALCLGGETLAVDGVLLVAEHGNYPFNEKQQHLYPRRRFFEETTAVVRKALAGGALAAGAAPAVFSDKHLSTHRWEDALWMVETARELKLPFMAGSSLPLTWRRPPLEFPLGVELEEALAVGYGGLDAYGFHALEMLQSMVERRRSPLGPGETGVRAVQCLKGAAVWEAGEAGRWSPALLEAALDRATTRPAGKARENARSPEAILIEYRDGLRASMLMLDGQANEFLFAARRRGAAAPEATLFWLQEPDPFAHFARLAAAIQRMFLSRRPTYPVERTLLTTGILLFAHDSLYSDSRRLETPALDVAYRV